MSEIASYSSSFISHSLSFALHLWTPEPEHRILSGREKSMSGCVAWGAVGCPSQSGPWAAGVLLDSGRWRLSYLGRPRIWLGMQLAGAMSISVLPSPP